MKDLTPNLGILILLTLVFNNSTAQKVSYTSNSGLSIGLGAGMSYQKSDLANSKGYGLDFILGSQLYKKENAFLSVDWKFRFLAGENKAYDHRINPDNTYSNIRYSFFTYDLELGLTLNRLREQTGIVLSGFAGAGLTHGRTNTDLYNAENSLYDFSSIDPNLDGKTVYNELRTLSDGDFETQLVNKAAILPTAGFFIGYQFSNSLMIGMEFKSNFYLTEHNSLGGINLDNRELAGSGLDRNNYVSVGVRWNLRGRSAPNPHIIPIENNPVPVSLPYPSVIITNPTGDSVHTVSKAQTIWATVNNVNGPDDISFFQNGFPNHSFTYNAATKILIANVSLRDGENSIRIQATNQTSAAEDLVIITLSQPVASANELNSQEDIQLMPKGGNTGFSYIPGSGLANTSTNQTNGDNKQINWGYNESVRVQKQPAVYVNNHEEISKHSQNESGGQVNDQVFVRETRSNPLPVIRLIDPVQRQSNTKQSIYVVKAEVLNVTHSSQLMLTVNGKPVSFSFRNNVLNSSVTLVNGLNTLTLNAKNEGGEDNAHARINYSPAVAINPCTPPKVSVNLMEVNRSDATHEITGSLSGVKNKTEISLTLDGRAYQAFQYIPPTGDLSAKFKLTPGNHTIVLSVNNACGTDSKSVSANIANVANVEEKACGPRINPGNSDWQFCLKTPSGTFSRENLSNPNFSYSGSASSLYFMPIAGGGDVVVNGRPYSIRSGQYYFFTGNLNVTVSTKNPGSMGQWSVCIHADREPVSGNGNNRPKSPCEEEKVEAAKVHGNARRPPQN